MILNQIAVCTTEIPSDVWRQSRIMKQLLHCFPFLFLPVFENLKNQSFSHIKSETLALNIFRPPPHEPGINSFSGLQRSCLFETRCVFRYRDQQIEINQLANCVRDGLAKNKDLKQKRFVLKPSLTFCWSLRPYRNDACASVRLLISYLLHAFPFLFWGLRFFEAFPCFRSKPFLVCLKPLSYVFEAFLFFEAFHFFEAYRPSELRCFEQLAHKINSRTNYILEYDAQLPIDHFDSSC